MANSHDRNRKVAKNYLIELSDPQLITIFNKMETLKVGDENASVESAVNHLLKYKLSTNNCNSFNNLNAIISYIESDVNQNNKMTEESEIKSKF
jgi:hypothetical protein